MARNRMTQMVCLVALISYTGCVVEPLGAADAPTNEELWSEIQSLKQTVADLQAQLGQNEPGVVPTTAGRLGLVIGKVVTNDYSGGDVENVVGAGAFADGPITASTTTRHDGTFVLSLPPGEYMGLIAAAGFEHAQTPEPFQIFGGETVDLGTIDLDTSVVAVDVVETNGP